jgi:hypothetical protein
MGVLPIRPNVPRGTLRRNSETDGANDPFAKLSECSTWNIRRSPPLVASSFSSRSFTLLRMGPSARGTKKRVSPLRVTGNDVAGPLPGTAGSSVPRGTFG